MNADANKYNVVMNYHKIQIITIYKYPKENKNRIK